MTRYERFIIGDFPMVCVRSGREATKLVPVQAYRSSLWPWLLFPGLWFLMAKWGRLAPALDLERAPACILVEMTTYTISEVAQHTGLSIDTLRHYERIELVTGIERAPSGHRRYTEDDVSWLDLLVCLRTTGMSIADVSLFAELVRAGERTEPDRIKLLESHRKSVRQNIALMQQRMRVIDRKIAYYTAQGR